jgi:cation transporter-like permease
MRTMPRDSSITIIASLESWIIAYRALEVLDVMVGPETLATSIAFVPSLADLIPRDAKLRANLGRDIGSSLASAEHAGLLYAAVRRIAALSQEEQATVIHDLWMEALNK